MTKVQILQKTSPENIYFHYLQLTKFPAGNIRSPFSEDKNPSFKLYRNGTFKCFSTGNQGDVFQFVAFLKNLDTKKQFPKVLNAISDDLNLIIQNGKSLNSEPRQSVKTAEAISQDTQRDEHFKIETVPLSPIHYAYWKSYGIDSETLQKYGVVSVRKFQYLNGAKSEVTKFTIFDGVLAFAYNVNNHYEIYIPSQPEKKVSKFFYNGMVSNDVFGFQQLPEFTEFIIIAAGKKDCLALNAHGYPAITFRSENHFPSNEQITKLSSRCRQLFICYDNDFDKPRNAGQEAQKKIIERFPSIIPIQLPEGINDVADLYFKGAQFNESFNNAKELVGRKLVQDAVKEEAKKTIFHIAEDWLTAHFKLRYNSIKLDIECAPIGTNNWKSVNENSLFITMQKDGINISIDKLLAILKSEFVPEYNPITEYFMTLRPWKANDKDYITELLTYVEAKDQVGFNYHFKKWLIRAVKCATIPEYFNKQAFILMSPKQNDGKTSFCRFLMPPKLKDYLAEDITNDKDARILLCKNLLINLDELAVLSKHEINSLKSFFTKTQINERLPYDRKNSIIPRICSFIGSTNQDEFLVDETGSVRWLCFRIEKIDWNYRQKIDINNVWAQAVSLAMDSAFDSEMSVSDIMENEKRNRDFQVVSIERELINKCFDKPDHSKGGGIFMTSTEIMQHIMQTQLIPTKGLNKIAIGRAMSQEGYERVKERGIYGYNVNPLTAPVTAWKPVETSQEK